MNAFEQVMLAALTWMLLGNSLRFAAVGGQALLPVISTGWGALWCKSGNSADCLYRFHTALDGLYIRLMSALTTAASGALVYAGILFMGVGMIFRVTSSVLRYTGDNEGLWHWWSQAQNVVSSPLLVIGMSCMIAAVSPRRTASLLMSAGFVVAGLGIGIVTTSAAFR